jgi:hypothetical protein
VMSGKADGVQKSRASSAMWAASAGAVFGAILGALVGASYGGSDGALTGALAGALLVGLGEALTDAMRKRGEAKPLFWRVLVATFSGAALGALFELILPNLDLVIVGLILGLLSGLLGLAVNRLLLGVGTGLVLGLIAQVAYPDVNAALLGGAIMLVYRLVGAFLFKGQEPLQVVGERVPHSQVRMVVPFDASSGYVGADYFQDLARTKDGAYKRNAPGAGIVGSMDSMRGPAFDPDRVDPLIREFYEHTTRFKLNIVPKWKRRMLPLFWLFKRGLAQRVGQANLPFDVEEAQRGVVSYIDTIDFDCDDVIDLRGWVRAFEETGEAIYVGVYTTFRDDEVGYVSVGFPFPGGNFTATLLPYNHDERELILKTRDTRRRYPGHYLSTIDAETGELTVLQIPNFDEEIHVYVQGGHLRTDHRFYLSGLNFLTLYYTMQRLGEA